MSTIPQVALGTTFLDWRTRTNDIIDIVNINKVGTPDKVQTLRDIFNYIDSAGVFSGCAITDNANGTIDVALGEALLRLNNTEGSELFSVAIDAQPNVTLTDNDLNYVYVDYNAGTPIVSSIVTSATINNNDVCLIAIISREGNNLTILEATSEIVDQHNKLNNMLIDTEGFKHVIGGTQISESGTNTRKVSLLSGEFYRGLNKYSHNAYDTAAADTFEYYYRDGVGGWTETSATVISNINYDGLGTGTLDTITAGKYVVNWVFLKIGSNSDELYVLYGQNEYDSINDAQIEVIPTDLPPQLDELGVMVGRIIIKQASTFLNITESAFGNQFRSTESLVKEVINGGTGVNTLSQYGVVIGNGAGPVHVTAIGTTGYVLTSNGAGLNPTYQEASAVTVGGITSDQFLRSDVDDIFTGDILTIDSAAVLRLENITDVTLASTLHAFQIGISSGVNIAMDGNEIMCRNNGVAEILSLNAIGGEVQINGNKTWHAGNDGTGSTLDADLLDGQEGSFYQSATNLTSGTLPTARIANNSISLAQMADIATASFIGRNTATTGVPEVLSATTARSILGIEAGATADQSAAEILTALLTVDGPTSGISVQYLNGQLASKSSTVNTIAQRDASGDIFCRTIDMSLAAASTNPTNVIVEFDNGKLQRQTKANFISNLALLTTSATAAASTLAAITNDTTTNATHYVEFASGTSGNLATKVSSTKLTFNPSTGDLTAGGDVTAYSDKRLKKDINNITDALNKVLSLNGCTYSRTDTKQRQSGLIAQEVKEILPEVVRENDNGMLSLAYGNMVGLLVEAIKELNMKVENMETK